MRQPYTLILAALSVLLNLAACTPDTPAERSAQRPAAPAPIVAPIRSARAAPARPLRNTVLAPAEEQQPAPETPAPRRPRYPSWLARRPLPRPRPLDCMPPNDDNLVTDVPAPIVTHDVVADAPARIDAPKTAQTFLIRPDRDTVLYGAEGTVMRIPAGTFVQGPGKGSTPQGPIEIRLREFYSMADILLERLSTMAGPKLLETGGMLQLTATTTDGKECKLKPGSALELGFPATPASAGMQLYDGQATPGHGLNWKLAPQAKTHAQAKARKRWTRTQHWQQPRFRGGYAAARQRLSKAIVYDQATAMQLNGYQRPKDLRRELRQQGRRGAVVGKVEASFELSERGGVNDVYFRNSSPADSALRAAVRLALPKLLLTEPCYRGRDRDRRVTRSLMKVDVRFTADQRVLVDHLRWDRTATLAMYGADNERLATPKGQLTDAQLQAAPLEAVTGELFKKRQANARRYSVKTFLAEQLSYVAELVVFRVQVVADPKATGWYNCDSPVPPLLTRLSRLADPSGIRAPKGGLAKLALVHMGLEHPVAQPADISLVLRERRTVIRGDAREGRVTFEQLADSTAATLVAIRREQGQLYLGLRDVVVRQRVEPPLELRPVTVAELRAAVARFDL